MSLVQFVGGPRDGDTMQVPELLPEIRLPVPQGWVAMPDLPDVEILIYQRTDEAADDPPHARIYRWVSR